MIYIYKCIYTYLYIYIYITYVYVHTCIAMSLSRLSPTQIEENPETEKRALFSGDSRVAVLTQLHQLVWGGYD